MYLSGIVLLIPSGVLLPVCARCTGLYVGLAVGPILGVFLPREHRSVGAVAALACVPAALGLVAAIAEAAGLISTGNLTRLLLGLTLTTGPAALGMLGARIFLADALGSAVA